MSHKRQAASDPTSLEKGLAVLRELVLGMLSRGVQTGYAIKRLVDLSTRFFWAASLAQVYPELAALEQNGYVASTNEAHGKRRRKAYRLTDKGEGVLQDWLCSETVSDFEFRDEGLLRLFFADAMPPDEALKLVRRLRVRAEENERSFRTEILPLAQQGSRRFPLIVAREGADYFAWRAHWFRELESELEDSLTG